MSNASTRLASAAEELVKAVTLEVDSFTHQKLCTNLESVKGSLESRLNSINRVVKALGEKIDSGIDEVNHNQADIKNLLEKQNSFILKQSSIISNQHKINNLQWAITHCEVGAFKYKEVAIDRVISSEELARQAIGWFMIDEGLILCEKYVMPDFNTSPPLPVLYSTESYDDEDELERSKQAFRDNMKGHIMKLIGKEPLLSKAQNGEYAIYYD